MHGVGGGGEGGCQLILRGVSKPAKPVEKLRFFSHVLVLSMN